MIRPLFLQALWALLREDPLQAEAKVDGHRSEAEVDGHQAAEKAVEGGYPPEAQEAAAGHRLEVDREAARQEAGDRCLAPCWGAPLLVSAHRLLRLWVLQRGR